MITLAAARAAMLLHHSLGRAAVGVQLGVVLLIVAVAPASSVEGLTATSVQRLAAMVDAAASMATSSEQLAATRQILEAGLPAEGGGGGGGAAALLAEPFRALGAINEGLRGSLQALRDGLGELFTTGASDRVRPVLRQLAGTPTIEGDPLEQATAGAARWTSECKVPGARALYQHFEKMHAEHRALEAEVRGLGEGIYVLREERAVADGHLAGLEERLGKRRARRQGEEYELARYMGSSLFRWELLRTKVAHHLAHDFTAAREEALEGKGGGDIEGAEKALGLLEEKLQEAAQSHKLLSERRAALGKKVRSFLKSLLLSCEAAAGGTAPEAAMSKKFQVLKGKTLGVHAQATEEFARFLRGAFAHTLPQTVALLEEVLGPYVVVGHRDALQLPTTWTARPKIGRWWEWLEVEARSKGGGHEGGSSTGRAPVGQEEFERRFAAAKQRFSVRVSAGEPVVMAYMTWLLLEEVMGAAPQAGQQEVVLSLPSPEDAAPARSEEGDKPSIAV